MPSTASGPGKTAPKLLYDFLIFDPLRTSNGKNYLTDFGPPVGDGPQLAPTPGSCKHEYRTKHSQSVTPPLDLRPDAGTQYRVAVICKKCRIHAVVHIDFAYTSNPCPNSQYPLHHFQRLHAEDRATSDSIDYAWQCSASECGAHLKITFRMPRLSPQQKDILTDTELLRRRYEAIIEMDPNRDGVRQATPMDSLARLRKYVKDALDPKHSKRTFPANNKRFMEAFGMHGRDCADILTRFGFKHGAEEDTGLEQWTLPQPDVLDDRLRADGTHLREILEDVEYELVAWMARIAQESGAVNPAAAEGWPSADKDIERTLAAQGYPRYSPLRRVAASNEELPYFYALGALPEFADSLVVFAFDQQILCDPEKRPYYLECLQVITESRTTETLQMKAATLESEGAVSRRDLSAAYRTLNIPAHEAQQADDERVLNLYHVRISDLGAKAQEDAREALYKIGVVRNSQRLMSASRQTMETYEDALSWLGNGAGKDTMDDGLLAIVGIKASEGEENVELARKAISIIARERKSGALNDWLLTGQSDGYQMSVDEALRHLGVEQKLEEVAPDLVPTLFEMARSDKPGENTEKAIKTIQQALAGTSSASTHSLDSWPVGLISHGNTCYLNSLLQYYFSMAPFRDLILNYDRYKFDIEKEGQKKQRVGFVFVDSVQIKGSQVFADDMKHLFERMIKEPSSSVKPEQDLVCRAFLDTKDYALLTAEQDGQNNAAADLEAAVEQKLPDGPTVAATTEESRHKSDASSTTLHGDDADVPMTNTAQGPPTPPASPGTEAVDKNQQPVTAPPLPPRNRKHSSAREKALALAQEKARLQQDVTEVHDAILDRLRFGVKPSGTEEGGEQEDEFRNLFRMTFSETRVQNGADSKPQDLFTTVIQVDVPSEPTDIYSALDGFFDLQRFNTDANGVPMTGYKSMVKPPPLLQISIPRIDFDKVTKESFKATHCTKLEDELYLDRYMDLSDPSILPKRRACWGWRKQLRALRKEQKALSQSAADLDGPEAVTETASYLSNLESISSELRDVGMKGFDVHPDLASALTADAPQQAERLTALNKEVSELEAHLKDQFTDDKRVKYRLAAVFFHRGSVGHGHYWVYIHDFENDMWRKYNDDVVEQFTKIDEILEAKTWHDGTPMYAVYVQDDKKTDIIKPVCRAPEQLPTPTSNSNGQEDVEMNDGDDNITVDPRKLTWAATSNGQDESSGGWDDKRNVPGVNWLASTTEEQQRRAKRCRESEGNEESRTVPGISTLLDVVSAACDDEDGHQPRKPKIKLSLRRGAGRVNPGTGSRSAKRQRLDLDGAGSDGADERNGETDEVEDEGALDEAQLQMALQQSLGLKW